MEKKIIAVALVLVLMVTVFVGCGNKSDKKYETIKIGGQEYLLITDEEGNTVVEGNQLVAAVTNRDGEVVTYADGEDQTHYVDVPGSIVVDGLVYGDNFTLKILKGWTSTDYNRVIKDKTDDKCYIQCTKTKVLEDNETFEDAFVETDKANEDLAEVINNEETLKELAKTNPDVQKYLGGKCTFEKNTTTFTDDAYPCKVYKFKIVDKDGNVIHYAESYYFLVAKTIYCVNYACEDGVGYDETFNCGSYLRENFTFVKPQEK